MMLRRIAGVIALTGAMASLVGCSGSGGGSSDTGGGPTSMKLSGTLSASANPLTVKGMAVAGEVNPMNSALAITLTDLEIYAVCFSNPPAIAKADVGATGAFEVTLACAPNNAVTAIFRVKSSLEEVGQVVFEDTSKKDLNGNAKQSSSVVLTGDTSFGNITINSEGKVVVPISQIAATKGSDSVAAGTAFDFNGAWQFSAYSGTLPEGYSTTFDCDPNAADGSPTSCNQKGIPNGFVISLLRFAGKAFTPGASCDLVDAGSNTFTGSCPASAGTVGTEDVYAVSVWMGGASGSQSAISQCGYKTNFTKDEARKFAGVDLDGFTPSIGGQNLTYERITYSAPTGWGGDTCADVQSDCGKPWQKNDATSRWSEWECDFANMPNISGGGTSLVRFCKFTSTYTPDGGSSTPNSVLYHGMIEGKSGGCVDSTGKPLRVDNWGTIQSSGQPSCSAGAVAGIQVCSQTYVGQVPYPGASAQNFTCSFSNGTFKKPSSTYVALSDAERSSVDWANINNSVIVAQGSKCKDIVTGNSDNKRLIRLRCYANSYYENGGGGHGGGDCSPRYRFNWGATSPAAFAVTEGRDKPNGNFITQILTYSPDGKNMFVNDDDTETRFISAGSNGLVRCDLGRNTKITMKSLSATQLLFDLTEGVTLNSSDAACRASAANKDAQGKCIQDNSSEICYAMEDSAMKNLAVLTKQ